MVQLELRGTSASPGVAIGAAWRRAEGVHGAAAAVDRERERDSALAALAAAAAALSAIAADLEPEQAEIVEAGVLMAQDPMLMRAVEDAVMSDGLAAADAILRAAGESADAIAALGDGTLAARADDVRSLGRRAALLAAGGAADAPPGADLILLAHDLGPADVAELAPALAGLALAAGGATAHAAIVARSLGLPMVTGLGPTVLELEDGVPLALDGGSGSLTVEPGREAARAAAAAMAARRLADQRSAVERERPAITCDGRQVTVLANVASTAELDAGLRAGAEGIGLLRTELAFLEAADWPDEQDHTDVLKPIVAGLGGRRAVVRVLDFGPDKSPPFLCGVRERGLELLLQNTVPLIRQLRAILLCAERSDVRILLPMVERVEEFLAFRALVRQTQQELGIRTSPPLGSMIETPLGVGNAAAIAERSDFLSIGTNDLTAAALGEDRFAENAAHTHDPRVLRLIAESVAAAHHAGITVEVCGEAASDPLVLPLLVGLGVDEVSVGAARVGAVRRWIRGLSAEHAGTLARSALKMASASEVERSMSRQSQQLQSAEPGEDGWSERSGDRGGSAQPENGSELRVEHGEDIRAVGA
jgi:phosphoenolpyruvate-protein kinase (PTS system EI component)